MGFKACNDALRQGLYVQLDKDKATVEVVFLEEPEAVEASYRGKPRTKFLFPVLTEEGVKIWSCGVQLYRHIRDAWTTVHRKAVTVTRHGKKDDPATKYAIATVRQPAWVKKALSSLKSETIQEAFEAAMGTSSATEQIPIS